MLPSANVKRVLEIHIVDEDIAAYSWDWIPACLTSYPSSRFFLEGGEGEEHMCVLQAVWNSEELRSSDSCLNHL